MKIERNPSQNHIWHKYLNNVPGKCERGVPIHDGEPWPRTNFKARQWSAPSKTEIRRRQMKQLQAPPRVQV